MSTAVVDGVCVCLGCRARRCSRSAALACRPCKHLGQLTRLTRRGRACACPHSARMLTQIRAQSVHPVRSSQGRTYLHTGHGGALGCAALRTSFASGDRPAVPWLRFGLGSHAPFACLSRVSCPHAHAFTLTLASGPVVLPHRRFLLAHSSHLSLPLSLLPPRSSLLARLDELARSG